MPKTEKLEFFIRQLWPIIRPFVKTTKRCKKCLLSEIYGPLNKDGVCQICLQFNFSISNNIELEASPQEKLRFDTLIKSTSGKGKKYDALNMLSGGKDSAYILERLIREYPQLRILNVYVNNGYSSEYAMKNAIYLSEKTKTDLKIVNSHIDEFSKAFKSSLLSIDNKGCYGVVDYTDGSMIFDIGEEIHLTEEIPLLIGGLSWVQVQMIVKQETFELFKENGSHIVFPLAIWRPNEQEIRKDVRNKKLLLPGSDSPLVSNNELILPMIVIDNLLLGYSSFEPEFAQLIREAKTDRILWYNIFEFLEYVSKKGYLEKEVNQILEKLGLTLKDIINNYYSKKIKN